MSITEESRFQLYQRLVETLGEKEAATLMAMNATTVALVVAVFKLF